MARRAGGRDRHLLGRAQRDVAPRQLAILDRAAQLAPAEAAKETPGFGDPTSASATTLSDASGRGRDSDGSLELDFDRGGRCAALIVTGARRRLRPASSLSPSSSCSKRGRNRRAWA